MWETCVWSLGGEDPLEKGRATSSSILAWRIPGTESQVGYSPWGPGEWEMTEPPTLSEVLVWDKHLFSTVLEVWGLLGPTTICSGRAESSKTYHDDYHPRAASEREGWQPGWAKSGFTVPGAHRGTSSFSHVLTILKPDFLYLSSQRGPDTTTGETSRRCPET